MDFKDITLAVQKARPPGRISPLTRRMATEFVLLDKMLESALTNSVLFHNIHNYLSNFREVISGNPDQKKVRFDPPKLNRQPNLHLAAFGVSQFIRNVTRYIFEYVATSESPDILLQAYDYEANFLLEHDCTQFHERLDLSALTTVTR